MSVNSSKLIDFISKDKFSTACSFCKPAIKCITLSGHRSVSSDRIGRHFTCLNKYRRIVSSASAVFVKDKPVAFGLLDGESHAAADGDFFILLVQLVRIIAIDIGLAFRCHPTLEIVLLICRSVSSADFITNCLVISICADIHLIFSKSYTLLLEVCDLVNIKYHGIVSDLVAVGYAAVDLVFNRGSDAGDIKRGSL